MTEHTTTITPDTALVAGPGEVGGDPPGVVVRLPDGELDELAAHADAITVGVATLLRRMALTAVRTTTAAGATPRQLITGAVAAISRDLPTLLPPEVRVRAAESVMRWLLARCAVVPLPAPGERSGVWLVRMDDGARLEVAVRPDRAGVRIGDGMEFSAREWRHVAACGLAAAGIAEQHHPPATTTDDRRA